MLRQIHLSILLIMSIYLPLRIPFISPLAPLQDFDVFIMDQLSVCVPILRWLGQTRVVFYCHFPDKLLAGGREVEIDNVGRSDMNPREAQRTGHRQTKGQSLLKQLYRLPFDKIEEATTGEKSSNEPCQVMTVRSAADELCHAQSGEADIVLANSKFTSRVYNRAFPSLKQSPRVVYPCINVDQYVGLDPEEARGDESVRMIQS